MQWNDANHNGTIDDDTGAPLHHPYNGNYTGEFTGGDYGIDEEIFDGTDNDGDGKIDKDVNKIVPRKLLPY